MTAHTGRREGGAVRTCAGCREKDTREALLRFAVRPDPPYVAPDPAHRLGGRGVSVHPDRACVQAAVERGGFARALRRPVPLGTAEVIALATQQYRTRVHGLLASARGAGCLAIGTDAVRQAMQREQVCLLLVAGDASNRREELVAQARRLGGACRMVGTRSVLGGLLDRGEVGVAGVTDPGLAQAVAQAMGRAEALDEKTFAEDA